MKSWRDKISRITNSLTLTCQKYSADRGMLPPKNNIILILDVSLGVGTAAIMKEENRRILKFKIEVIFLSFRSNTFLNPVSSSVKKTFSQYKSLRLRRWQLWWGEEMVVELGGRISLRRSKWWSESLDWRCWRLGPSQLQTQTPRVDQKGFYNQNCDVQYFVRRLLSD